MGSIFFRFRVDHWIPFGRAFCFPFRWISGPLFRKGLVYQQTNRQSKLLSPFNKNGGNLSSVYRFTLNICTVLNVWFNDIIKKIKPTEYTIYDGKTNTSTEQQSDLFGETHLQDMTCHGIHLPQIVRSCLLGKHGFSENTKQCVHSVQYDQHRQHSLTNIFQHSRFYNWTTKAPISPLM